MAHLLTLQTHESSVFPFVSLLLGKTSTTHGQHFQNHVSAETHKPKEMLSLAYYSL